MATPKDAMDSGLRPADREFIDFTKPVSRIKEQRDISKQLMTKEQAAATTVAAANTASIQNTPIPSSSGPSNPGVESTSLPLPPPTAPTPPQSAAPLSSGPPVFPSDVPRVSDRINKLYGRMRSAEERASDAETRLADLLARLEGRMSSNPQVPVRPPVSANPYEFDASAQPAPDFSAGGNFVSRQELRDLLGQQTRALMEHNALTNAHVVARAEAERDFPDVFGDLELRASMNEIWQADQGLHKDPMGPYKAAALARGLSHRSISQSSPTSGPAPAAVRKEALSAIGASVPEGPAPADDRVARYHAALARAQQTGREEDAVYARLIAQGLA